MLIFDCSHFEYFLCTHSALVLSFWLSDNKRRLLKFISILINIYWWGDWHFKRLNQLRILILVVCLGFGPTLRNSRVRNLNHYIQRRDFSWEVYIIIMSFDQRLGRVGENILSWWIFYIILNVSFLTINCKYIPYQCIHIKFTSNYDHHVFQ